MYPTMEIYATACNDFPECVDEEDEKLCFDNAAISSYHRQWVSLQFNTDIFI